MLESTSLLVDTSSFASNLVNTYSDTVWEANDLADEECVGGFRLSIESKRDTCQESSAFHVPGAWEL